MSAFNIFLVIVGLTIIAISYLISEKLVGGKSNDTILSLDANLSRELSDDEKQYVKNQIDQIISEITYDTVITTSDQLSKISNEKIISVSELTDQILEKINLNHSEVVFLYNMLNDKEVKLKQLVQKINQINKTLKVEESHLKDETNIEMLEPDKKEDQMEQLLQKAQEKALLNNEDEAQIENGIYSVKSEQILELNKQGMSIVDISRKLEMGQGEVKLIIELYQKHNTIT